MPLTRLELPTWTYQLPNTINPLSSYFKFVTASKCGDQIAFCSRLKTEEVEKTRATFHRKPQPYGSMGRATDVHSGGHVQLVNRFFFEKSLLFHIDCRITFEMLKNS